MVERTISGIVGGMTLLEDGVMNTILAAFLPLLRQQYPVSPIILNVSIVARTTRFGIDGGMADGIKSTCLEDSLPDAIVVSKKLLSLNF